MKSELRKKQIEKLTNSGAILFFTAFAATIFVGIRKAEQDIEDRLDMLQAASNTCTSENGGMPCSFELMLEKKLIPVHPHTYPGSKSYSISEGVVKFRKQLAPNVRPIKKSPQL